MNLAAARSRIIDKHFHALTHRNYRYFWMGQCVSLIGTWMQTIGQSWLVLSLTGSPFLLGLVGTIQFLPITIFSLFAGVMIDKFPKKRILLFTQTVSMFLALILSLLVFTDSVKYGYILVIAFMLGLINTIDMPTRQSFNIELVGKEDLMSAIGLNSMTFNLARILGPSIGAVLMAYLGAGWCFLVNGLSFIPVIYGLLKIEPDPYLRAKKAGSSILNEIKDGILYIARNSSLAQTLLLVTVVGTLGFNFGVLIPVFTKNVLLLDEKTYGILMSCLGFGALTAAVTTSVRSKKGPQLSIIVFCSVLISICLVVTGFTKSVVFTGILLVLQGFFNITFATNCNSFLQINSKDEFRARVMSIYALVFAGSTPVGNLVSGYMANHLGANGAFFLLGIMSFIPTILIILYFRKKRQNL